MSKRISWVVQYAYKWNTRFFLISLLAGIAPCYSVWSAQNAPARPNDFPADIKRAPQYLDHLMSTATSQAHKKYIEDFFKHPEGDFIKANVLCKIANVLKKLGKQVKAANAVPNPDPRDVYWKLIIDWIKKDIVIEDDLTVLNAEDIKTMYEMDPSLRTYTVMKNGLHSAVMEGLHTMLLKKDTKEGYEFLNFLLKEGIAQFPIPHFKDDKSIEGWSELLLYLVEEGKSNSIDTIIKSGYFKPYKIKWVMIFEEKKDFGYKAAEKEFMDKYLLALEPDPNQGGQDAQRKKEKAAKLALVAKEKGCFTAAGYIMTKKWADKEIISDLSQDEALHKWQSVQSTKPEKAFWQAFITYKYDLPFMSETEWNKKIKKKERSDKWKVMGPPALLVAFTILSIVYFYRTQVKPRMRAYMKRSSKNKQESQEKNQTGRKKSSRTRKSDQSSRKASKKKKVVRKRSASER